LAGGGFDAQKKYGVKLTLWRSSSEKVLQRAVEKLWSELFFKRQAITRDRE